MAEKQWTVVSNNDKSRTRTHFAGLEKDAREFVRRNFPRPHVEPPSQEPGIPDVKLVSPDGAEDTFHGDDGWASENEEKQDDVVPADESVQPVAAIQTDPKPITSDGSLLA